MGASRLSFLTIRSCLFVEGISDMLLLPSLFRQILNEDHLGFQIVHGIANISPSNYGLLENDAPKVAFLLDNDRQGCEYKKQLKEAKIEDTRIFMLPSNEQASILEDFICLELYVQAINELIKKWHDSEKLISNDDFSGNDRPAQLKIWLEENKIKSLSKLDIAYELLDIALGDVQGVLVDERYKNDFVNLYQNIIKEFH
jgi:predicted ATP-dependent endonuclease of OLD family